MTLEVVGGCKPATHHSTSSNTRYITLLVWYLYFLSPFFRFGEENYIPLQEIIKTTYALPKLLSSQQQEEHVSDHAGDSEDEIKPIPRRKRVKNAISSDDETEETSIGTPLPTNYRKELLQRLRAKEAGAIDFAVDRQHSIVVPEDPVISSPHYEITVLLAEMIDVVITLVGK